MKVFVSAAEISSDQHAALVAKAITELRSGSHPVQFFGIGGPALRALPNFTCIQNAEAMRTMGIFEVLAKISFFKATMQKVLDQIVIEKPDLILTLDYPDFHLRLLKQIKERNLAPNALKICGIPPKVWVWRSHRVEQIRKYYDGVWAIFPFEKSYYQARGIPVIEEGNPLLWKMTQQRPELITDPDRQLLTVMPGSRDGEWRHLLPIIPETLNQLSKRISKPVHALVPVPEGLELQRLKVALTDNSRVKYSFLPGGTVQALSSTTVGLIKSGTSTLEAVILGCAPIIFYRMNWLTEQFFIYFMRYRGPVGLPNILLGIKRRANSIFPEILGSAVTPKSLSVALQKMIEDRDSSPQIQKSIKQVQESMHIDGPVPQRIADQMLQWMQKRPPHIQPQPFRFGVWVLSLLWSCINWARRKTYQLGFFTSKKIPVPSILIGNLQAGGAGKTPLLIELAKEATARGLHVAVVSRGYGSKGDQIRIAIPGEVDLKSADFGDEPVEIKSALPNIYLGVGANRIQVVNRILERSVDRKEKIDLVLFDDGFQNLKFKPSITILVRTPLNRGQTVYRDFDMQANTADYVFDNPGVELNWEAEFLPSTPIWIVCGVANPVRIRSFYESRGVKVDRVISFPDHHPYTEEEVKKLVADAKRRNVKIFITDKDAAKWKSFKLDEPIGVLKIKLKNREWMNEVFDRIACIPLASQQE